MGLAIDTATPNLDKLKRKLAQKSTINKLYARAVAILFRKHFRKLSGTNKNRFGVKNSFWDRMRNSVRKESTPTVSAVIMDRAVALRKFGGTVNPTGSKRFLTIPIHRDAYGKKAAEFEDSYVITTKRNKKFIAIDGDDGDPKFLYLMTESTQHKPNSAATPDDEAVKAEAFSELTTYLNK